MAKPGIGILIASKAPPPGKFGKHDEPDSDEMGGSSDKDEDDAAELSAMEDFMKSDNAQDKLEAFKNLLAICGKYMGGGSSDKSY